MTNFEKYKEQFLEFIYNTKGPNPVVVGGKVIDCNAARCSECEFGKKKKEAEQNAADGALKRV